MPNINVTEFVLRNRAALFSALEEAGIDMSRVVEKVNRRYPYGKWNHPVEIWQRPIISSEKGLHLANYWLTYPAKGDGKTVKFNISTFETITQWLNQPKQLPPLPPLQQNPLITAADSSSS